MISPEIHCRCYATSSIFMLNMSPSHGKIRKVSACTADWFKMKGRGLSGVLTIEWADQKWWHFPEYEGYTSWAGLEVEKKERLEEKKNCYTDRETFFHDAALHPPSVTFHKSTLVSQTRTMSLTVKHVIITVVIDLHVKQKPKPKIKPRETFDVGVLATGTHHPGSGCCTSCMRSRRPLYVQTPLQPHPPSPDGPASRRHTRRRVPEDTLGENANARWMSHRGTAETTGYCNLCDLLTTMSSSVTRGWRLFTVIFVPSNGLKAGWNRNMKPHDQARRIRIVFQSSSVQLTENVFKFQ